MIFNNNTSWSSGHNNLSIDDNLSFDKEMLRQAELRLNKVHSHDDGSPVSLQLKDNNQEGFEDITKHVTHPVNTGGQYGDAMVPVNFECGCGNSFSLNDGEFTDLNSGTALNVSGSPQGSYITKNSGGSNSGYSSGGSGGSYGSGPVNY